jgi:hypothetical protein
VQPDRVRGQHHLLIVVAFFGFWIFSKFFGNLGKLRQEA